MERRASQATSPQPSPRSGEEDAFIPETVEQLRVLRLEPDVSGEAPETTPGAGSVPDGPKGRVVPMRCVVELWQLIKKVGNGKAQWQLVETRIPVRLGKPLPLIPFVFHGPRHSGPDGTDIEQTY